MNRLEQEYIIPSIFVYPHEEAFPIKFCIGDIVARADDFSENPKEYTICHIRTEVTYKYDGRAKCNVEKYKFRVQVMPKKDYHPLTYTKTFPYRLLRRKADDAREVD